MGVLADGSLAPQESGTLSPGIDVAKKVSGQDIKDISAATLVWVNDWMESGWPRDTNQWQMT